MAGVIGNSTMSNADTPRIGGFSAQTFIAPWQFNRLRVYVNNASSASMNLKIYEGHLYQDNTTAPVFESVIPKVSGAQWYEITFPALQSGNYHYRLAPMVDTTGLQLYFGSGTYSGGLRIFKPDVRDTYSVNESFDLTFSVHEYIDPGPTPRQLENMSGDYNRSVSTSSYEEVNVFIPWSFAYFGMQVFRNSASTKVSLRLRNTGTNTIVREEQIILSDNLLHGFSFSDGLPSGNYALGVKEISGEGSAGVVVTAGAEANFRVIEYLAPEPQGPTAQYYNGTSWVPATITLYNGTSWVPTKLTGYSS